MPTDPRLSFVSTKKKVFLSIAFFLLTFGLGVGSAFYFGGYFIEKPQTLAAQPLGFQGHDFSKIQAQLDRIERVVSRPPQIPDNNALSSPAPQSWDKIYDFLTSFSLNLADQKGDKLSVLGQDLQKQETIMMRDILDDLLLFFAMQNLTSTDVDVLNALIQRMFPEKNTDALMALRSSYANFSKQASDLVLLSEPIVAAPDIEEEKGPSFWRSLLNTIVTVRAPADIATGDANALPEVVAAYNASYDTWQNVILPSIHSGHLEEAARAMETFDAKILFEDASRWQAWKRDFDTWLNCYHFLVSIRMDITRRMIHDVFEKQPEDALVPSLKQTFPSQQGVE